MELDFSYDRNDKTDSDSSKEIHAPRRPHKSGKHNYKERTSLTQLLACPLTVTCFQHQSCYQFYEMVERVNYHREFARLFLLHLHDDQNLAGVTFTLTPETIAQATSIPNVGEQWNKGSLVDKDHYEPYMKVVF